MTTVYSATKIVYEGRGRYTPAVDSVLAATLLVVVLILLGRFLALVIARRKERGTAGDKADRGSAGGVSSSCPLCSSLLGPGERVKSDIYPGRGDRIMRIFGCPRCLPPFGRVARVCPVCHGALHPDGWVVARYFERPGRRHVHVLGCTICHPAAGGTARRQP